MNDVLPVSNDRSKGRFRLTISDVAVKAGVSVDVVRKDLMNLAIATGKEFYSTHHALDKLTEFRSNS